MFADIVLPINLPQLLTYGIPLEMQHLLQAGMRAEVSLGKNKVYAGIVTKIHNNKPENYSVKPIKSIIDSEPVVTQKQLEFWQWVGSYYMAAPGEVMSAALPAHLKLMAETRLEWMESLPQDYTWSAEATSVAAAVAFRRVVTITELRELTGSKLFSNILNELLENEAVVINDGLEEAYTPRKEKLIYLAQEYTETTALKALFGLLERAPKQLAILMAYLEIAAKKGYVSQKELSERANVTAANIKTLIDKQIFTVEERNVDRVAMQAVKQTTTIDFTPSQAAAYKELEHQLLQKNTVLLHGVTGSGKTLLYIRKIWECMAAGRQVLMLVPEIGLTTQLVSRLHSFVGEQLGVYHSRFTNNERVEIWEKVRHNKYSVVLGPRSALWLPFRDLGLIIVDEEHDVSYKQKDPAPRFHARDAAVFLASVSDAKVILGSATPAIETLHNAKQGKYGYVWLNERFQGVNMPEIQIIHAKSLEKVRESGVKLLTPELQQAIAETLAQRKQVILFQNKRGYTPFQLCSSCGWVPQCRYCAVSLTYHKTTDKMHCHYCGMKTNVPAVCPSCGGTRIVSRSFGTEKIEEEVQQVFPKAKVARMDMDSMRGRNSLNDLLDKLDKGKTDILVGTQMVVKGLDFPHVNLIGILNADALTGYPDFRVNERAFQLMEQVSGRAGRSDGKGKVIIQAYNTTHQVLQWVKEHDFNACYVHEINFRQQMNYPPFCKIIKIIFKHLDENKAMEAAQLMATALEDYKEVDMKGPAPAVVSRVRNYFLHEIWIKCPKNTQHNAVLKKFLLTQKQIIAAHKGIGNLSITFDVDPY
jgi:primosomal protein N' (replication factor Y) (superfamily II helicase)